MDLPEKPQFIHHQTNFHQVSTALERFSLQTGYWSRRADRQLTEGAYQKVMEAMRFGQDAAGQINQRIIDKVESFLFRVGNMVGKRIF